jgi:opacity protein-like surface antigen
MRKTILIIGFVSAAFTLNAQKSFDYGITMGTTQNHLYTILPIADASGYSYAAGGYYRHSQNPRYSWRGGLMAGFDRTTFQPNMLDAYGLFEVNFHPLSTKRDKKLISSYVGVGLSYLVDFNLFRAVSQTPGASMGGFMTRNVRIPFNVGVRYNVTTNLTIGAEWALRKGYQQDYENPDKPFSNFLLANWRSHFGITVGYMVSNYCKTCPFYDNERKKLK